MKITVQKLSIRVFIFVDRFKYLLRKSGISKFLSTSPHWGVMLVVNVRHSITSLAPWERHGTINVKLIDTNIPPLRGSTLYRTFISPAFAN